MLETFFRWVGVHFSVDSVMQEFHRLTDALDRVIETHEDASIEKRTRAAQLTTEAGSHDYEVARAFRVKQAIKGLLGE